MHEAAIRRQLKRDLGSRYTDRLWSYLLSRGFVAEVVDGAAAYDDYLLTEARLLWDCLRADGFDREASASSALKPSDAAASPTPAQERALTLSKLLAYEAKSDPEVTQFRRLHMNDELIAWETVETWLTARRDEDGPVTTDLTITLPAGAQFGPAWQPEVIAAYLPRSTGVSYSTRVLDYALPGDDWVRRVSVRAGGTLDHLRRLSEDLANAYGWMRAQATIHVLTGIPAFVAAVRSTAPAVSVRYGKDVTSAQRIVLDVDPACTPEELIGAFQRVRRQQGLAHLRPLSRKHLRLAAFACAVHSDKPWAERHQLWNRTFPDWAYAASSNFRRDAIRAQHHVLYPGRHRGGKPLRG